MTAGSLPSALASGKHLVVELLGSEHGSLSAMENLGAYTHIVYIYIYMSGCQNYGPL